MCGIFGINLSAESNFSSKDLEKIVKKAFLLSERRGKDASGILSSCNDRIEVLKSPVRASILLKSREFKNILSNSIECYQQGQSFSIAGHTRMVTNGSVNYDSNNQPVIKDGATLLHNGIIVNELKLLAENKDITKKYEVDSEVVLSLFNKNIKNGYQVLDAFQSTVELLQGANTFALFTELDHSIYLHSSNKSLYFFHDANIGLSMFSSERNIINGSLNHLFKYFLEIDQKKIIESSSNVIYIIDILSSELKCVDIQYKNPKEDKSSNTSLRFINQVKSNLELKKNKTIHNVYSEIEKNLKIDHGQIDALTRCKKCVLPETFPYLFFDEQGICNFCNTFKKFEVKGKEKLIEDSELWKMRGSFNDVLVPLSGGRDSCYGLHFIKKELNLNPVAYTYDWGFVTDKARRNISRICGELSIEHILVAADIRTKRSNVKKNVTAWLSAPEISLVPLFLAGDKFFYKYASSLRKEMNLSAILFSLHSLEVTNFKTGFANVDEKERQEKLTGISNFNKLKLSWHYFSKFLENPKYLNSTIPDTFMAFVYYYIKGRDYFSIFDYIPWNENEIISTIKDNYGWEGSSDGELTWRIGDGTAPFYNYIYLKHSGFCENDTFRSNQIREGLISRGEAIEFLKKENQIDVEAYKWYCDTIEIDAVDAIKSINRAFSIKAH